MNKKSKSTSLQFIVIIIIITLIFSYIAIDIFRIRPEYKSRIENVSNKHDSLNLYLIEKIPEIDAQLVDQLIQIRQQDSALKIMQEYFSDDIIQLDSTLD